MTGTKTNCDLCDAQDNLATVNVPPKDDAEITLCGICRGAVEGTISQGPHWRCLNEAIWSTDNAIKVTAYRLLSRLNSEGWARDLLDIAYLDPDTLNWAKAGLSQNDDEPELIHRDTNGAQLAAGDTVTLIKDLNVKGAGFTAKRGTAVRGISLVPDNDGHIEGRVNGQQIVILTEFVKKS